MWVNVDGLIPEFTAYLAEIIRDKTADYGAQYSRINSPKIGVFIEKNKGKPHKSRLKTRCADG